MQPSPRAVNRQREQEGEDTFQRLVAAHKQRLRQNADGGLDRWLA